MPVEPAREPCHQRLVGRAGLTHTVTSDLIVGHFLDVVVKRLDSLEGVLGFGALPKAMHMTLNRVPLDADNVHLRLVDSTGRLPALAVGGSFEQRACTAVGRLEFAGPTWINLVTDVLDNHRLSPRTPLCNRRPAQSRPTNRPPRR